MPKWTKRLGAGATVATGLLAWTGVAQAAAPPAISLGSASVAVTLPNGCRANDFRVVNSPDGSYHGYIQATCEKKGKLFYISRSPAGQWALRSTGIDLQSVRAVAVDNTGTYFVGVRSHHDLVLVRRNGNGSLSKVHVLQKSPGPSYAFDSASVVASNGNYWATWSTSNVDQDIRPTTVSQARTMAPGIAPRTVGQEMWSNPTIVTRPGKTAQLLAYTTSSDSWPPDGSVTYSAIVGTPAGTDWKQAQQFSRTDIVNSDNGTSTAAAYLGGHTYFSHPDSPGIYDDRSGSFALTKLTGKAGSKAILGITGSRVAFIGTTGSAPSGREVEWLQNSDGTFNAAPTGTLSAAPVPVRVDQIINRSGALIRLLIQEDTVHHEGGTRLLQQVQS